MSSSDDLSGGTSCWWWWPLPAPSMTDPDPEVELAVHALVMEDPLGDLVRVVFPIPPAPVMPTTRTFSCRSSVVNASTSVFALSSIFSLLAHAQRGRELQET